MWLSMHTYVPLCRMSSHIRSLRDWSVFDVALTWVPECVYWIHECVCWGSLWLRLGRNSKAPEIGKYALICSQLHIITLPISLSLDILSVRSLYVLHVCQVSLQEPKQDQAVAQREEGGSQEIRVVEKSQKMWNFVLWDRWDNKEWSENCKRGKENQTLKYCPLTEKRQRMRGVKIARKRVKACRRGQKA